MSDVEISIFGLIGIWSDQSWSLSRFTLIFFEEQPMLLELCLRIPRAIFRQYIVSSFTVEIREEVSSRHFMHRLRRNHHVHFSPIVTSVVQKKWLVPFWLTYGDSIRKGWHVFIKLKIQSVKGRKDNIYYQSNKIKRM